MNDPTIGLRTVVATSRPRSPIRQAAEHGLAEIARLRAIVADLRAALQAVEWGDIQEDGNSYCPDCWGAEHKCHRPDCRIAAALAKARGGTT